MTGLSRDLQDALAALARETPGVAVLIVFGSGASGRLRADSDLDLYVRVDRDMTFDSSSFAERAGRIARRDVHLHVESPASSVILRREVAARGRLLFERAPGAHRDMIADAIRVYLDFEPMLTKMGKAVRARAADEGRAAAARVRARGATSGR